jgi:hypothetical protein
MLKSKDSDEKRTLRDEGLYSEEIDDDHDNSTKTPEKQVFLSPNLIQRGFNFDGNRNSSI